MQENSSIAMQPKDEGIDLLELFKVFGRYKWLIIIVTLFITISSVFYSYLLPDIYRSEVLLSAVEEGSNNSNSDLLGQIGGLANLAGINVGSGGGVSQKTKAIAILRSRAFIQMYFDNHDLAVAFMAAKPTGQSGQVEIDPAIYDETNQSWVREIKPPRQAEPTDMEIYQAFSEILRVQEDPTTGLVTVSLEWYDPVQIKKWLDWMIVDLNELMKNRDVAESRRAIEYLSQQLERTQLVEMRNVFYNLIEQQTRTIMLADARTGYAFEVLDPAIVPEQIASPSRILIWIVGFLAGLMISVFFVLILNAVKQTK